MQIKQVLIEIQDMKLEIQKKNLGAVAHAKIQEMRAISPVQEIKKSTVNMGY